MSDPNHEIYLKLHAAVVKIIEEFKDVPREEIKEILECQFETLGQYMVDMLINEALGAQES